MANTLLTIDDITRELLMRFENNIVMAKYVLRNLDEKFGVAGRKIGETISTRKPPRFEAVSGEGLQVQSVVEEKIPVALDKFYHVGFEFSQVDLHLKVDDFGERYLESAAQALANKIDFDLCALYLNIPNFVGTPETVPTTNSTYLEAGARLTELGCPVGARRYLVVNPNMMANIVGQNAGGGSFFHPSEEISKQYRDGRMGRAFGFGWSEDPNINSHTVGNLGGTPLVNGADQTGSSLTTDGWTASITDVLKKGDIITLDGVNAVNPLTGQSTGRLRQFVVTADVASDGSGNATIPISPSIVTSGPRKTVTGSPADNAVILIFGNASSHADAVTPQGLAFNRDFATLVMAQPGDTPKGVDFAGSYSDKKSGLGFQVIRDYDIQSHKTICRVNVLYGVKVLNEDFACRVVS